MDILLPRIFHSINLCRDNLMFLRYPRTFFEFQIYTYSITVLIIIPRE